MQLVKQDETELLFRKKVPALLWFFALLFTAFIIPKAFSPDFSNQDFLPLGFVIIFLVLLTKRVNVRFDASTKQIEYNKRLLGFNLNQLNASVARGERIEYFQHQLGFGEMGALNRVRVAFYVVRLPASEIPDIRVDSEQDLQVLLAFCTDKLGLIKRQTSQGQ